MDIAALRIETPRLVLRPPRAEDFDAFAAFRADETSMRYIGGVQPRAVAWRAFLSLAGAWMIQGFSFFSLIEKSTGRWVGIVGPWQPVGWPGTEIGWSIVRDRCNVGYATEAATTAIDWAFANLAWTEIIHCINVDNTPSQAVARKLGSMNRGRVQLPEPYTGAVVDVWGQTREAWLACRKNRIAMTSGA